MTAVTFYHGWDLKNQWNHLFFFSTKRKSKFFCCNSTLIIDTIKIQCSIYVTKTITKCLKKHSVYHLPKFCKTNNCTHKRSLRRRRKRGNRKPRLERNASFAKASAKSSEVYKSPNVVFYSLSNSRFVPSRKRI